MPPIFRLFAWFERRRSLCRICRENPHVPEFDGYCSAACEELDADLQAHG